MVGVDVADAGEEERAERRGAASGGAVEPAAVRPEKTEAGPAADDPAGHAVVVDVLCHARCRSERVVASGGANLKRSLSAAGIDEAMPAPGVERSADRQVRAAVAVDVAGARDAEPSQAPVARRRSCAAASRQAE